MLAERRRERAQDIVKCGENGPVRRGPRVRDKARRGRGFDRVSRAMQH